MRVLEDKIKEQLKKEGYVNPQRPFKRDFTTYVYEIKNPFGEIIKIEKYDYETYRKINPNVHNIGVCISIEPPQIVANHEKTLIPVGTAIIIVAAVK